MVLLVTFTVVIFFFLVNCGNLLLSWICKESETESAFIQVAICSWGAGELLNYSNHFIHSYLFLSLKCLFSPAYLIAPLF